MLKTGLIRPLMREILDKTDESEGRVSELLIDSATDESEVNSTIKATQQERGSRILVQISKGNNVIDKINEMKTKLGSKVSLRETGKKKLDSETSAMAVNSAE